MASDPALAWLAVVVTAYAVFILPPVYTRVDRAVCWWTGAANVSQLTKRQLYVGRFIYNTIASAPVGVLCVCIVIRELSTPTTQKWHHLKEASQGTTDCPFNPSLDFLRGPLCWLYAIANQGHAIEAWWGIPGWMSWFSTPELPINQLIEAMYFLVFFGLFGLVLPTLDLVLGRRDSPDWTWKQDVRLAGGLTATAWFILCLSRALARLSSFIFS